MTTVEEMALAFLRGHWALEQVMAVCAKIRMRLKCKNKKKEKRHIFVFLTVMFALGFLLSAVLILLWDDAVYAFLTHDGLNRSSLLDYLSY